MRLPFHNNQSVLSDYAIFTDESGLAKDRYLLIGGLSCRSAEAHLIQDKIKNIQLQKPFPNDSLQWKHITAAKLPKYRALMDLFVDLNSNQRLDFTCLVADKQLLDHSKHNDGDGEIGFQKLMYQTYMAVLRKYWRPSVLRGLHGNRDCPFPPSHFLNVFNSGAHKEYPLKGGYFYRPMLQMGYMEVATSPLHQLADLILGAVSWHWNKKVRGDATTPKGQFAQYVLSESPLDSFIQEPQRTCRHFHLWQFRLEGRQT